MQEFLTAGAGLQTHYKPVYAHSYEFHQEKNSTAIHSSSFRIKSDCIINTVVIYAWAFH